MLGRSGTPVASWFMNESDLLVVFGASFANHTGIAPYKPIMQVDAEPDALGRFHAVTVPVLGDIGVTAARVRARGSRRRASDRSRPAGRCRRALGDLAGGEGAPRSPTIAATAWRRAAVFAALSRHVPADAVIAVDVGNNTYSFGRYFECKPASPC